MDSHPHNWPYHMKCIYLQSYMKELLLLTKQKYLMLLEQSYADEINSECKQIQLTVNNLCEGKYDVISCKTTN